jgi:hypothetical protein
MMQFCSPALRNDGGIVAQVYFALSCLPPLPAIR